MLRIGPLQWSWMDPPSPSIAADPRWPSRYSGRNSTCTVPTTSRAISIIVTSFKTHSAQSQLSQLQIFLLSLQSSQPPTHTNTHPATTATLTMAPTRFFRPLLSQAAPRLTTTTTTILPRSTPFLRIQQSQLQQQQRRLYSDESSMSPAESAIAATLSSYSALQPTTSVLVRDVSGGCGSMYAIDISSPRFKGLNLLAQQRLVNKALGDQVKEWHGVQIRTSVSSKE